MKIAFWRKKTIVEILKQHLALMTHDQKIEHLKTIIPLVMPGIHISLNPPGGTRKPKAVDTAKAAI